MEKMLTEGYLRIVLRKAKFYSKITDYPEQDFEDAASDRIFREYELLRTNAQIKNTSYFSLDELLVFAKKGMRNLYQRIYRNGRNYGRLIRLYDPLPNKKEFKYMDFLSSPTYSCHSDINILIQETLEKKEEKQRDVFSLKVKGFSQIEIAKALDISESMVCRILKYDFSKLRKNIIDMAKQ